MIEKGKSCIRKLPLIGPISRSVIRRISKRRFRGSRDYWERRYRAGGNSGSGSYGELAEFKASVLNEFVVQNNIQSVIEFGCGDGNQLRDARYPSYLGFDVSVRAVELCQQIFRENPAMSFRLMDIYSGEQAELGLSLDVIYHLVEDRVFEEYMSRLFASSTRYVIIYSSNKEYDVHKQDPHVKHRVFTDWVDKYRPGWRLVDTIRNRYPFDIQTRQGSLSDFYIYERE